MHASSPLPSPPSPGSGASPSSATAVRAAAGRPTACSRRTRVSRRSTPGAVASVSSTRSSPALLIGSGAVEGRPPRPRTARAARRRRVTTRFRASSNRWRLVSARRPGRPPNLFRLSALAPLLDGGRAPFAIPSRPRKTRSRSWSSARPPEDPAGLRVRDGARRVAPRHRADVGEGPEGRLRAEVPRVGAPEPVRRRSLDRPAPSTSSRSPTTSS